MRLTHPIDFPPLPRGFLGVTMSLDGGFDEVDEFLRAAVNCWPSRQAPGSRFFMPRNVSDCHRPEKYRKRGPNSRPHRGVLGRVFHDFLGGATQIVDKSGRRGKIDPVFSVAGERFVVFLTRRT